MTLIQFSATGENCDVGTATITLNVQNRLEFASSTLTGCVMASAAPCKANRNDGYIFNSYVNVCCFSPFVKDVFVMYALEI